MTRRDTLIRLFDAAIGAALPHRVLAANLPAPPKGRTIVLGAGKAGAAMAAALEAEWPGALEGLVVTRYGHAVRCERVEIVEAAHPEPDEAGVAAAGRILALAEGGRAGDLVIALISGGGSSLLCLPAAGLSLADKQRVSRDLLASGAPIGEMNAVRKHLSAVKGGRLAAAAHPARTLALAISDVPGDDPATIASGPTVADPTTLAEARAALARRGITPPDAAARRLVDPAAETPKPGDPRLAMSEYRLVAAPMISLQAAAAEARRLGFAPVILGDALEGEARDLGADMARRALAARGGAPTVLLSGGETTVTLPPGVGGRGGRNVEFLLALAAALDGAPEIDAIACDTDGVDGMEEVAGATVSPDTLSRAEAAGYPIAKALAAHDGHGFFAALGDQVVTGPTLTNVNDFRAILVG